MSTKRFETHQVRRIPIVVSREAEQAIHASSAEGRKFPLALAEAFGKIPQVVSVELTLAPKSSYFSVNAEDFHPVTGKEARLLCVTAHHQGMPDFLWLLNMADIEHVHVGGQLGFRAHLTAHELLRLYPYKGAGE